MAFPQIIDNFTNPTPSTPTNSPVTPLSGQLSQLNNAVEAIEGVIGVTGSTVPTSIEKRLTDAKAVADLAMPRSDHAKEHAVLGFGSKTALARNVGGLINALTSALGIAWSGGTGATGSVDGTFPGLSGENTLWIEAPIAGGGTGWARAIITQNVRFAATDSVSVRIKVEDPCSLRFFQIQLVQGAVVLSLSSTTDGLFESGGAGWFNVSWKLSDFTVSGGSADYNSDFTSYRFQIGAAGSGGAIGRIALSNFRKNSASSAIFCFAADSSYDDVYDVHSYFAATGIPFNVYTNCALLDTAGYLTTVQAQNLYNHPSNVFELANYPTYKPALGHTATGIASSQAVAAPGNLTLNGSLTTGGVANLGAARKVVLSGSAVSRTVVFTITGTLSGAAVTDYILGPAYANGLVESTKYFDTVTQIAVSAAISGTCTVGTSFSVAELTANLQENAASLTSRGFVGSELNVAYPGGQIAEPLYAAMAAIGAKTGRTTYHSQTVPKNHLMHDASWNKYLLSGVNLATAVATVESMLDDLANRGGVLVGYFHTIAATVDGVNPTAEHLARIIAYAKALQDQGKLQCVKLSTLNSLIQNRVLA